MADVLVKVHVNIDLTLGAIVSHPLFCYVFLNIFILYFRKTDYNVDAHSHHLPRRLGWSCGALKLKNSHHGRLAIEGNDVFH